jgi:putative N6-adenine-specific DNA methylase
MERIFAACAPGLEPVLERELRALGLDARAVPGGAEASAEDAVALACIGARCADAVALRLFEGAERDLRRALALARRRLPGARLAVRRERGGATVSADAAGTPLYKRGWRTRVGAAPLRESFAAGMLLYAGYDGTLPFLDPMCGSGTLAIEAAEIAARRAPGRLRRFAFEGWPGHDAARTAAVRRRLAAGERRPPAPIHAADRNAGALRHAARNAAAAGVAEHVRFARSDAARVTPPDGPGVLAVNPPFGVRLTGEVAESWRSLGSLLARLRGWTCLVLAPDRPLEDQLALPLRDAVRVRNGGLACRLVLLGT